MLERGKISASQMAIMMNPTILATALLLVPAITAKHAQQDLWISPLWASLIGFATLLIAHKLHSFYPNKTLIQYCELILGKVLGKILGLFYLFFYLHITGIIIREYGEFVSGAFLHYTPMLLILGTMVLVCSFAVHGGLEVIGRCSEIIVPVLLIFYLLIFLLLYKDLEIKNMFPILENGLTPSLMGAIVPQSWFSEYIIISFLLPYVTDQEKSLKWGSISILSVLFFMLLTNFTILLLFGKLTATLTYPVMVAARYISIAEFLEHLEAIIMAVWIAGTFVKITVFYYTLVLGTAQWLKLSDFRPMVLPIGFLLLVVSIWSASNLQELSHFLGTSAAFYLLSMQIGIPIILLAIAFIRNFLFQKKGSATG